MDLTANEILKLKNEKIGILVRNSIPTILKRNLISQSEIEKLQEYEYSKFTFDVNYPVLKKINEKLTILENRTINEHTRYYANPIENDNVKYLYTCEWFERSQEDFIKWLRRKVKDENNEIKQKLL